jgi:hypothetical protein
MNGKKDTPQKGKSDTTNKDILAAAIGVIPRVLTILENWKVGKETQQIVTFISKNLGWMLETESVLLKAKTVEAFSIDTLSKQTVQAIHACMTLARHVNRYRNALGRKTVDFYQLAIKLDKAYSEDGDLDWEKEI